MTENFLPSPLYTLQSISLLGDRTYGLKLAGAEGELEVIFKIRIVEGEGLPSFDLIECESEEFNTLCAQGRIFGKPLGKALLAFHECICPTSGAV